MAELTADDESTVLTADDGVTPLTAGLASVLNPSIESGTPIRSFESVKIFRTIHNA
jgi:hypothetical protein